jgi:probable rRNA maturation factor
MAVSINNSYGKPLSDEVWQKIEQIADEALIRHGLPPQAEISLTLCDDRAIHALNKQWRDIDSPTDVLSFPLWEGNELMDAGELPLGDIIISVERAEVQAGEFGHSLERELLFLFTHGVLHLLGYDHMDEDERQEMRTEEESLLSGVGAERNGL